MGFFSFNKIASHRIFNYTPRYYDPDKEARDAIVRRAKVEAGLVSEDEMDKDVENAKRRISKAYHSRGISNNYKRASHRKSNIRIVVIIVILAGLAYIILNFNVDLLVKMFE